MNCKCKFCGAEVPVEEMILDEHDNPKFCPHCERSAWADMDYTARIYAERYGLYEYEVNGTWIEYWSFFSGEGFRFVQQNLVTGEEHREGFIPWTMQDGKPLPKFLRSETGGAKYNYNCG